jgi:long-chain acyl-CoA synthetase
MSTSPNTWGSLPALLLERAGSHGPATILRKKDRGIWQAITWSTLASRVRAIGLALKDAGIGPGVVAGILAETGPDWIAADLAIQGAGGISLGLAPTDPGDPTAVTLAAAGCQLLFVENEEQLDKVLHIREHCPSLARIVIMDMKGLRDFADPMCISLAAFSAHGATLPDTWAQSVATLAPSAIALLSVTSGTSEAPRLAALSHANLVTQIGQAAALTGQTASDERLGFLPLSLAVERIFGLYLALWTGTISNLVESAETVPENLQEVRPTVMFAIPRIWQKLHATVTMQALGATWIQRHLFNWAMATAAPRADGHALGGLALLADRLILAPVRAAIGLDRARLAFVGGTPVSDELVRWFLTLGVNLRQIYGTTECGGLAALSPADANRAGSVGTPVPWGELTLSPSGEVLLRGPHICAGLWHNGSLTPATDAEGWLHTGDLGRMDNGQLVLTGRQGEALTTADGREILPAGFESRVKLSPFIADAVLVGHGRATLGCLVILEFDAVEKWAQDRNIPFTSTASLVRAEEVQALIAGELRARAPDMVLAAFRILARRIEPEDPEVTPAMRLRRHFVLQKHHDLIEDIYRPA